MNGPGICCFHFGRIFPPIHLSCRGQRSRQNAVITWFQAFQMARTREPSVPHSISHPGVVHLNPPAAVSYSPPPDGGRGHPCSPNVCQPHPRPPAADLHHVKDSAKAVGKCAWDQAAPVWRTVPAYLMDLGPPRFPPPSDTDPRCQLTTVLWLPGFESWANPSFKALSGFSKGLGIRMVFQRNGSMVFFCEICFIFLFSRTFRVYCCAGCRQPSWCINALWRPLRARLVCHLLPKRCVSITTFIIDAARCWLPRAEGN